MDILEQDECWNFTCTIFKGTKRQDGDFITRAFSKSKFIDIVCHKIKIANKYTGVS